MPEGMVPWYKQAMEYPVPPYDTANREITYKLKYKKYIHAKKYTRMCVTYVTLRIYYRNNISINIKAVQITK